MDGSNQEVIDAAQAAELTRIEQKRQDAELAAKLEANDAADAKAAEQARTEQERQAAEEAAKLARDEQEADQIRLAAADREYSEQSSRFLVIVFTCTLLQRNS